MTQPMVLSDTETQKPLEYSTKEDCFSGGRKIGPILQKIEGMPDFKLLCVKVDKNWDPMSEEEEGVYEEYGMYGDEEAIKQEAIKNKEKERKKHDV